MYRDTKAIRMKWILMVDPCKKKSLNFQFPQMQMIEIAKAFSHNAKIVIMDEPTSSLSEKKLHLFKNYRQIKTTRRIVYISQMDEISKSVMKLLFYAIVMDQHGKRERIHNGTNFCWNDGRGVN